MNQTGFDFNNLPKSIKAQGYEKWNQNTAIPYRHYDSTFAFSAGSIYSTTTDLLKWAKAVSERQILAPKTWEVAFKPKIRSYGYGWMSGELFGMKYVRHAGGYPGYMSEFIYYPDSGYTIILLNNFGTYDQNVWSVGMGISCIVFQLPYDKWAVRQEIVLDKLTLQSRVGTYQLNFAKQKSKVNIKLEGDKLYLEIEGLKLQLYAENETHYFLEYFNAQLIFDKDKIVFHSHGQDGELTRK
jgi:hypothetical protein